MDVSDSQALGLMREAARELDRACVQSRLALNDSHALLRAAGKLAGAGYSAPDGGATDVVG